MSILYWVEDEIELLSATFEELEEQLGEIRLYTNAMALVSDFDRILSRRGPIIVDLWVPLANDPLELMAQESPRGPGIGFWLLDQVYKKLENSWPVFILSGNLSFDIRERLVRDYDILPERIFRKPLNSQVDSLIAGVTLAAADCDGP